MSPASLARVYPDKATLVTRPDWRLPSSEAAKEALIGKPWGSEIDGSLEYEVGYIGNLTEGYRIMMPAELFVGGIAGMVGGGINLFQSTDLPGRPMIMCVFGRMLLRPAVMNNGRYCPLYLVRGNVQGDHQHINFHELWGTRDQPAPVAKTPTETDKPDKTRSSGFDDFTV